MSNDDGIEAALAFAGVAATAAMLWKVIDAFQGSNNKSEAERLFKEGVDYENRGMYLQAFDCYKKCLEKNSDHAGACNGIAWALAVHNEGLDTALRYIGRAIQLASNNEDRANFFDTLAEIQGRLGNLDEAIVAFRTCLGISKRVDYDHPMYSPSFRLALCYWLKQDINSASFHIGNALKVNSINPFVYAITGDICLAQERYTTSVEFHRQAINYASQWNFMHPILGDFDTSEQRRFWVSNWWVQISYSYYQTEDYENSWNANVESYRVNNFNPFPLINLASLCAYNKNKAEMRRFLEAGIPLIDPQQHAGLISFMLTHPNFENYRDIVLDLLLSNKKITQGEYKDRKKALMEGRKVDPDHYNVYNIVNSNIGNLQHGSNNYASDISVSSTKRPKK